MNRATLLASCYLTDRLAGDPEWFPHPVRTIGSMIAYGERNLRHDSQSPRSELIAGAALVVGVVGSSYWTTRLIRRGLYRRSPLLGNVFEAFVGWTCLAEQSLKDEANSVVAALDRENLSLARQRLSRIVGRDTVTLNAEEVSRAVIETVAESASDGILAPLFYMAIGGVPLAIAYKAVNTLDSMIGHADDRYFYFGKAAARLDDLANYIPSRLSALSLIAAAAFIQGSDPFSAWHTWLRDSGRHKSPNAGQPESAMAGALRVRLGGDNCYAGEIVRGELMGSEFPNADAKKALRSIRLVSVATVLGLGLFALVSAFARPERHDSHG